jgi:cytoskeletal protein RodZ
MNSKLSFLTRAAAVAGIVALALPALAQTNPPAAASTQAAPVAKSDSKAKKGKAHTAKKHDSMMKTAKTDAGHKPAPVKTETPASNAGK